MRSLTFAEWLLARFTSESRAVSMVGDLLEDSRGKGRTRFWLSISAVFLSLVWRRFFALAAAIGLGLCSFDFLHNLVYIVHAAYQPPHGWKLLLDFVCLASILLSFGMAYTAIRFGLKDEFTQQIIAAWGLACILSAYWWMPPVTVACTILGAWGLLSSAFSSGRRRALIASVVALGLGFAIYLVFGWYFTQSLVESRQPVFNRLAFYVFTLGLVLQPAIYSRVHAIFWADKIPGAQS